MAGVLLDTTALIDVLRGRESARVRLDEMRRVGDVPFVCSVNVEEIARGLRKHEQDAARRLVAGLSEVPLGSDEGWRAGEWRRDFAERRITLTQADCLVAAAAAALGGRLATGNPRHFPMAGLSVEQWPVGA